MAKERWRKERWRKERWRKERWRKIVGSATASGLAAFTREFDGRAVKEAFGLVEELAEAAANLAFGGGQGVSAWHEGRLVQRTVI